MTRKTEYAIGDKFRGHVVVGFTEPCEAHCKPRIVCERSNFTRTFCVECMKDKQAEYRRKSYQRQKPRWSGEPCSRTREGVKFTNESYWWSPEVDRKIDEFWKKRGIDPNEKFRNKLNIQPVRRKKEAITAS